MLALAIQRWGLDRRIAFQTLKWVGTRPAAIVAGIMGATAFVSMWVSNTATAAMMLRVQGVCGTREVERGASMNARNQSSSMSSVQIRST